VNSVSETEKKRQEAINEVIYTERDFVRDMEYLRDVRLLLGHVHLLTGWIGLDQTYQRARCYPTSTKDRFLGASVLEYP
jgi:hypothetical protein